MPTKPMPQAISATSLRERIRAYTNQRVIYTPTKIAAVPNEFKSGRKSDIVCYLLFRLTERTLLIGSNLM